MCPSCAQGEKYTFPNVVWITIGDVTTDKSVLFGLFHVHNPLINRMKIDAKRISNSIKESALKDGYYVKTDFNLTENNLDVALRDPNIYGFTFFGHGGSKAGDALMRTVNQSDIRPDNINLNYHLGQVILNACYSDTEFKGSKFIDKFKNDNLYGIFKGHAGYLYSWGFYSTAYEWTDTKVPQGK